MSAPSSLSRRAALAAGAGGLLVVSACGQEAGAPWQPASADDPDQTLVAEAVDRITTTAGLSGRVPELTAVHTAHLAALDADAAVAGIAPLDRLRRAEADLQRFLVDAARRAESGPLARLFATMSAAISQQLATFPASGQGASR